MYAWMGATNVLYSKGREDMPKMREFSKMGMTKMEGLGRANGE